MENFELTMGIIENYKKKACEYAKVKCDFCEAMYEHADKQFCCFDTVNRFIKWNNKIEED